MVRSMYSGVSGLRAHQTRMDSIGNNIANVNTYGFKSSRTTFRDIYYQTMSSASGPNAAAGGMNPSQVGYGSQVGSVDLMMSRSTFSMTDQTMDLAIDGDGFFQVMDGAGNIYYTRAGMMNFDAAGNLVDMQGNYVLGINGNPSGRAPASERISVSLPSVQPTASKAEQTINKLDYRLSTSKPTADGNLNFNITTDSGLADDEVVASISSTGIIVKMHPDNVYNSWGELNAAINSAITEANDGKEHAAGVFTFDFVGNGTNPLGGGKSLTAAEICGTDYGIQRGSVTFASGQTIFGGMYPTEVGSAFSGTGSVDDIQCDYVVGPPAKWKVTMKLTDGKEYEGFVEETRTSSGDFSLTAVNGDKNDTIKMKRPSFGEITAAWMDEQGGTVGEKAVFNLPKPAAASSATSVMVMGVSVTVDPSDTVEDQMDAIFSHLQGLGSSFPYEVTMDSNKNLKFTARAVGAVTLAGADNDFCTPDTTTSGVNPILPDDPGAAPFDPWNASGAVDTKNINDLNGGVAPAVKASQPSKQLGLSNSSFALRGGTEGGDQDISDMTNISFAPNGIITGWDSIGREITIGRIDLATFANQAGLTQAGSSNYMASANSGAAQLSQPGTAGAGGLVGGTLELSNVDLSREFSDMITTQRGYQANSRIITVSDTMLEELINLKR